MPDRTAEPQDPFGKKAAELDALLAGLSDRAKAMQTSGVRELNVHSTALLQNYANTGQTILAGLVSALADGNTEDAQERASELVDYLSEDHDRSRIMADLPNVAADGRTEVSAMAAGRNKTAALALINAIPGIIRDLKKTPRLAQGLADAIRDWHEAQTDKEDSMASNGSDSGGIEAILQDISRQIGFIGTRTGAQGASTTTGAGSFRNVGAQLAASLDALSLPHDGVQFADEGRISSASDMLIDGLLDNYRQETRNGNTVFVPGRTEGRAPTHALSADMLAGAARVAARLVRSEEDVILEILDRLPDMTRFRLRTGVPSLRSVRDRVAAQFNDIDDVMSDPLGVNLPQAQSAIARAIKATFDFLDYANLEFAFFNALERVSLMHLVSRAIADTFQDEVGLRPSVTQAEELRAEIHEIAEAYARLYGYVSRPLSDTLGRTAARLDRQLGAINRSAADLRATLSRFGTSQAEQDLIIIIETMSVDVETAGQATDAAFEMSIGQLIGWIIKTSTDSRTTSGRVTALEAQDLGILAVELQTQAKALSDLMTNEAMHRFALGLGSVTRQIEELQALVNAAADNATTLAGARLNT